MTENENENDLNFGDLHIDSLQTIYDNLGLKDLMNLYKIGNKEKKKNIREYLAYKYKNSGKSLFTDFFQEIIRILGPKYTIEEFQLDDYYFRVNVEKNKMLLKRVTFEQGNYDINNDIDELDNGYHTTQEDYERLFYENIQDIKLFREIEKIYKKELKDCLVDTINMSSGDSLLNKFMSELLEFSFLPT
jgi:hypothetical protein